MVKCHVRNSSGVRFAFSWNRWSTSCELSCSCYCYCALYSFIIRVYWPSFHLSLDNHLAPIEFTSNGWFVNSSNARHSSVNLSHSKVMFSAFQRSMDILHGTIAHTVGERINCIVYSRKCNHINSLNHCWTNHLYCSLKKMKTPFCVHNFTQ